MPEKITVDQVNRLSKHEFVGRFGRLYEHSPWVAEEAWKAWPFGSLADLHGAMAEAVEEAPEEIKIDLILAHPDLAGKAALAGELTPESTREQASAGLDRLSPEEFEAFTRANREYREKFGFPLIFAVREYTKESILEGAAQRLENTRSEEIGAALAEISKIVRLRLRDLVEDEQ
jgi:2-oxo-4-hydroxy-4-carboxy-5-ureidoimidazoline decarboxylase